ncbi:MAG: hypothetical protein VYC34_03250, partial [Planctomycetota bacterium]|nr:hypothetical protein [Planctomycetota bacterium]
MNARKSRLSTAIAAVSGLAIASSAAAQIYCPCTNPPDGVVKTKKTKTFPDGGKYKLTCTNESATGNFITIYCKPDGTQHEIGECIFRGGKNRIQFVYDPWTGELCYIIHHNMDDANDDPRPAELKIYQYDVKGGTVTTTCYDLKPDGTYEPIGPPTCVPATAPAVREGDVLPLNPYSKLAQDGHRAEEELPERPIEIDPQVYIETEITVDTRATGSREISVHTNGFDLIVDPGDRIEFNIPASYIQSINPDYVVTNGRTEGTSAIVAIRGGVFNGSFPLAVIDSAMGRQQVEYQSTPASYAALVAEIEAVDCNVDVAFDPNPWMDLRMDGAGALNPADIVADLN